MVKAMIINTDPITNFQTIAVLIGVNVKLSISTMMVIGRTEYNTSLNFVLMIFKTVILPLDRILMKFLNVMIELKLGK